MTPENKITLTEKQTNFIDNYWQDFSELREMTNRVFGREGLDGRTLEGRAVREYMLSKGYKFRVIGQAVPKDEPLALTEEQKQFVINNLGKISPMEMAKILFSLEVVQPLGKEKRCVDEFIKQNFGDYIVEFDSDGEVIIPYNPPTSIQRLIPLVRNKTGKTLKNGTDLTKEDQIALEAMLGYLNNYRFKRAMENYEKPEDRELFEASFIDYTIDKPDLTQSEIQSYINVCTDQVKMHKYEKQMDALNNKRNREIRENTKQISIGLTEAIEKATQQYDKAAARVSKAIKELEGTRNDRVKNTIDKNKTLLTLIEAMQSEETRRKMLHVQKVQSQLVAIEIERVANAGEEIAKIMGIHKNEIVT